MFLPKSLSGKCMVQQASGPGDGTLPAKWVGGCWELGDRNHSVGVLGGFKTSPFPFPTPPHLTLQSQGFPVVEKNVGFINDLFVALTGVEVFVYFPLAFKGDPCNW